jgi:hypothetical protein
LEVVILFIIIKFSSFLSAYLPGGVFVIHIFIGEVVIRALTFPAHKIGFGEFFADILFHKFLPLSGSDRILCGGREIREHHLSDGGILIFGLELNEVQIGIYLT